VPGELISIAVGSEMCTVLDHGAIRALVRQATIEAQDIIAAGDQASRENVVVVTDPLTMNSL
jgi:predicted ribosome-associated RNA-binding protein Tma20